jgi:hypothetical protein
MIKYASINTNIADTTLIPSILSYPFLIKNHQIAKAAKAIIINVFVFILSPFEVRLKDVVYRYPEKQVAKNQIPVHFTPPNHLLLALFR